MSIRTLLRYSTLLFMLFFSGLSLASKQYTTDDFKVIKRFINTTLIKHQGYRPKNILLVLDDDNTLTTNDKHCAQIGSRDCQYLGGVAWWDWQTQLMHDNPKSKKFSKKLKNSNFRIFPSFEDGI